MIKVNGYKAVKFEIEVFHKGERCEYNVQESEEDTLKKYIESKSKGFGVTIIARNRFGMGDVVRVGLIKAFKR